MLAPVLDLYQIQVWGCSDGSTMGGKSDLLEKLILGEVEGKNRAIHAYDGMVWKIRTGFLTLPFDGPGYREAAAVDGVVYLAPLLILLVVIRLLLY